MELKPWYESVVQYGHYVLIVPFMELKLQPYKGSQDERGSLNRTFYGIET